MNAVTLENKKYTPLKVICIGLNYVKSKRAQDLRKRENG